MKQRHAVALGVLVGWYLNLGGFDCLLEGHRRQDSRQPLGQHRLARTTPVLK
jgi:hypothetical protein